MGNLTFGAPRGIIERVRSRFDITAFIETGTYKGETAAWASKHFDKVFTIEGSPDLHRQALERHRDTTNVEFILGDSRSRLREVIARLGNTPALFWLDAHWMPGVFGEGHECPLLDEIAAVNESPAENFVLIDDARLFLAPPPLPHRANDWPDLAAVLSALRGPGHEGNYVVVCDDVIISTPAGVREAMQRMYQERATENLNSPPAISPSLPKRISGWLRRKLSRSGQPASPCADKHMSS